MRGVQQMPPEPQEAVSPPAVRLAPGVECQREQSGQQVRERAKRMTWREGVFEQRTLQARRAAGWRRKRNISLGGLIVDVAAPDHVVNAVTILLFHMVPPLRNERSTTCGVLRLLRFFAANSVRVARLSTCWRSRLWFRRNPAASHGGPPSGVPFFLLLLYLYLSLSVSRAANSRKTHPAPKTPISRNT